MRLQYSDIFVPQAIPVGSSQGRAPVQPVPVGDFGETPETAVTQGIVRFSQNIIPVLDRIKQRNDQLDEMRTNADKVLRNKKASNDLSVFSAGLGESMLTPEGRKKALSELYSNNSDPTASQLSEAIESKFEAKIKDIVSSYQVDEMHGQNLEQDLIARSFEPRLTIKNALFSQQTREHELVLEESKKRTLSVLGNPYLSSAEKEKELNSFKIDLDEAIAVGTYSPEYALSQLSSVLNEKVFNAARQHATNNLPLFFKNLKENLYQEVFDLKDSPMAAVAKKIFESPDGKNKYAVGLDPVQVASILVGANAEIKATQQKNESERIGLLVEGQTALLNIRMRSAPTETILKLEKEISHRKKYAEGKTKLEYSGGDFSHLSIEKITGALSSLRNGLEQKAEFTPEERTLFSKLLVQLYNNSYKGGSAKDIIGQKKEYHDLFLKVGDGHPAVLSFWAQNDFIADLFALKHEIAGINERATFANGAKISTNADIERIKTKAQIKFQDLDLHHRDVASQYLDHFIREIDEYHRLPTSDKALRISRDPTYNRTPDNPNGTPRSAQEMYIDYLKIQHLIEGTPDFKDPVELEGMGVQFANNEQIEYFKNFEITTVAQAQAFYKEVFKAVGYEFSDNAPYDPRKVDSLTKELAALFLRSLVKNDAAPAEGVKLFFLMNPPVNNAGIADPSMNTKLIIESGDLKKTTTILTRAPALRVKAIEVLGNNGISSIPGFESAKDQKELINLIVSIAIRLRAADRGRFPEDLDVLENEAANTFEEKTILENLLGNNDEIEEYLQKAIHYTILSRFSPAPMGANGETELLAKTDLITGYGQFPTDPEEQREIIRKGQDRLRIVLASSLMQTDTFEDSVSSEYRDVLRRSLPEQIAQKLERSTAELSQRISKAMGQSIARSAISKEDYEIHFEQNSTGTGMYAIVYFADPNNLGLKQKQFILKDPDDPTKNLEFEISSISRNAYQGDRFSTALNLDEIAISQSRNQFISDSITNISQGNFKQVIEDFNDDDVKPIPAIERYADSVGLEWAGARPGDIPIFRSEYFNEYPFTDEDSFFSFLNVNIDGTPDFLRGRISRQLAQEFLEFASERFGGIEKAREISMEEFRELQKEFIKKVQPIYDNLFIRAESLTGSIGISRDAIDLYRKKGNDVNLIFENQK